MVRAACGGLLAALLVSAATADDTGCGTPVALEVRPGVVQRYALAAPRAAAGREVPAALLLLAGGSGRVDLDPAGCPRGLRGNSLVRSIPLFVSAGFATALVDVPSDLTGDDGLGGFRAEPAHAADLGRIIADLRDRSGARQVWVVGTSRGSISAANAASRLRGPMAPDGVVLTSIVTSGGGRGWTLQTVFDLPLGEIRMPLLAIGHAQDRCLRSPPGLTARVAGAVASERRQLVIVEGGSGGVTGPQACEGRSPHGFLGQEAEVADGIARFVRGGAY